jgi:hypothetical protein
MTPVRLKSFNSFLIFILLQIIFLQKIDAVEICTPPQKQTRYVIQSGEDFYSILKNFGLEPVIGDAGSLEALQKINNRPNQTSADVGSEIILPLNCEEQLLGWRVIDKGVYRLITSEKIDKTKGTDAAVKTENLDTDQNTTDILNNDIPGSTQLDLEAIGPTEEVSEALRYRMICDGEWTGTECITRYSTIFVTGAGYYNRYDGTDRTTGGQGTLLSKLNPEVGFGWNNYWAENFRTDLYISLMYNEISPEIRERPIEQRKKTLNSASVSARYEVGKWGFSFGLEQKERLFYRFVIQNIVLFDDGGVVVNAVPLLGVHAGVSYMFHQEGKFRFDAETHLTSIQGGATSGYNVTPGTALDFGFTVQQDRIKEYLFGTVKYELSQQDTDILLQKAAELSFKFGYAWKLKDW